MSINRRELVIAGLAAAVQGSQIAVAAERSVATALRDFEAIPWRYYAAAAIGPNGFPPWKVRLETEHTIVAAGKKAVPALLRATKADDTHVRALAAQMLGVIGDAQALPALERLAGGDAQSTVRLYAVEAASRLVGADASAVIAKGLTDKNQDVKWMASRSQLRRQQRVPTGAKLHRYWTSGFDQAKLATAAKGKRAPDFMLESKAGVVRLSQFAGKRPVVLIFQLGDW